MLSISSIGSRILGNVVLFITAAAILFLVFRPLYNIFFHPLRAFPGPLLWRASPIPRAWALVRGKLPFEVLRLREQYGPVVRIGPRELAFTSVEAWRDIYGHRGANQEENPKDMSFYRITRKIPHSLISADRATHGSLRRQMSHGFSERSMRGQEAIIGGYVDLLIQRLHERCNNGATALNMREWFNWTTFDIIGNLAFGSDFQCLETSKYTPWIRMITETLKQAAWLQGVAYVGLAPLARWVMNVAMISLKSHQKLTREKVLQRIELGKQGERFDFLEGLIRKVDNKDLSIPELASNASTLIIAGSETTATLLSGALFLLTTNPEALARLTKEVRTTFKNEDEITLLSVQNLPYMLACLNESLRRYPPVAGGLPRVAQAGGTIIAGHHVPEAEAISVWQMAINHAAEYWTDPYSFKPERWTGEDPRYANDCHDAMQPFSLGPRNCIGRNLAYAEMRLILARVIYAFDVKLAEDSRGWLKDQLCYVLWDKPALNVYLTPVAR